MNYLTYHSTLSIQNSENTQILLRKTIKQAKIFFSTAFIFFIMAVSAVQARSEIFFGEEERIRIEIGTAYLEDKYPFRTLSPTRGTDNIGTHAFGVRFFLPKSLDDMRINYPMHQQYPLIIFSPGYPDPTWGYKRFLKGLAKKGGYIIAAIESPHVTDGVELNGAFIPILPLRVIELSFANTHKLAPELARRKAQDVSCVLDFVLVNLDNKETLTDKQVGDCHPQFERITSGSGRPDYVSFNQNDIHAIIQNDDKNSINH